MIPRSAFAIAGGGGDGHTAVGGCALRGNGGVCVLARVPVGVRVYTAYIYMYTGNWVVGISIPCANAPPVSVAPPLLHKPRMEIHHKSPFDTNRNDDRVL